jgi:hypothetical protein
MTSKVKLAKIVMKLFPSKPTSYPIRSLLSETINYKGFINAGEKEKNGMLFEMARRHYLNDQMKPFDLFFSDHSLKKLLCGKKSCMHPETVHLWE